MKETIVINSLDWTLLIVLACVYLITAIVPAIWLSARKRSLDKFIRLWHPIAVFLTVLSGIAIIQESWGIKLLLVGIAIPLVAIGSYLGYLLYSLIKNIIKK